MPFLQFFFANVCKIGVFFKIKSFFILGGLSVVIDGPAKADIKCHDNKDGTCSVSWIPPAPGEYKVRIKFADKEISGSPFVARIAGTRGESRLQMEIFGFCMLSHLS